MFVDGVIDNIKDVKSINKAIDEEGLLETRRILKQAFREMDPYYNKKDNWKYFITNGRANSPLGANSGDGRKVLAGYSVARWGDHTQRFL